MGSHSPHQTPCSLGWPGCRPRSPGGCRLHTKSGGHTGKCNSESGRLRSDSSHMQVCFPGRLLGHQTDSRTRRHTARHTTWCTKCTHSRLGQAPAPPGSRRGRSPRQWRSPTTRLQGSESVLRVGRVDAQGWHCSPNVGHTRPQPFGERTERLSCRGEMRQHQCRGGTLFTVQSSFPLSVSPG